jgi:hypothetical protein
VDSSGSGYGSVVGCCEHFNESSGSIQFLTRRGTISFPRILLNGVTYIHFTIKISDTSYRHGQITKIDTTSRNDRLYSGF